MKTSRFDEASSSPAKAQSVGIMEKSQQVLNDIDTADSIADSILGMISGEGHAEGEQPLRNGSLDGIVFECGQSARVVVNKLERIAAALDPSYNKPKIAGAKG